MSKTSMPSIASHLLRDYCSNSTVPAPTAVSDSAPSVAIPAAAD